jgi:hypothetical protein
VQQAFFGEPEAEGLPLPALPNGNGHGSSTLEPISIPERFGALLLIASTLVIGLFPSLLLRFITPSFNSPLFEGLRKTCGL